jgi:hypothetical protein
MGWDGTYGHKKSVHSLTRLHPSLRAKHMRIGSKHILVVVRNPSIHADVAARREVIAADCYATRGHDAPERKASCGMQAEGFLDDGVEVGKRFSVFARRGACCEVELVAELG